jgi:endonuclease/exonuclease/phosphatase family metal-dependent hydrolase
LPTSHEVHVDALVPARALLFSRLRRLAQWLLSLPGLRALRPLAQRVSAVAEPAGWLSVKPLPTELTARQCETITVLSANLWHDWPRRREWPERLEAFARLVETEHADIVLLQEVARTPGLRADEWLARRLGMAYTYSRANGHETAIGFEEGLAVFSRFPVVTPFLRHLGARANPFVRRLALGAEVETPCGSLLAFSVHLGLLRRQNAEQLAHLRAWVGEVAGTRGALIGGDFNAHEHSPRIAQTQSIWLDTFRHLHPHADGTTHELRWPGKLLLRRHRLDYIFLHPGEHRWNVLEARHVDAPGGPHSDHRAVLARLAPEL